MRTLRFLLGSTLGTLLPAQTLPDYDPPGPSVVLNTDMTTITPKVGSPYLVIGGVFVFNNVTIRQGVTVKGVGSKPMIWVVYGTMQIDGTLTVRGDDGTGVNFLNSANLLVPGGQGNCGGGTGGAGSPSSTAVSPTGQAGYGPGSTPGLGGQGGNISCLAGCGRGSGGGGGSFTTQGDPHFKTKQGLGTVFVQQVGLGGYGCTGASGSATRTLAGGTPGRTPFLDNDPSNDFWGLGVDLFQRKLIRGDLTGPLGGQGGGGGGDLSLANVCPPTFNPSWIVDPSAGSGGGGGGVLAILALGKLKIGATGTVEANGGHGDGGEQGSSNTQAGGGGGGSGGMILLYTKASLEIATHGETYANNDYNFAISADGGISKKGNYAGTQIDGKYVSIYPATVLDATPTGGFGGMGLVQIMVPPGTSNADGTNTILDDNITVLKNGVPTIGAEKMRYLAWRGFPNNVGTWVDDAGKPTSIGDAEGDIRPSPILLPVLD